MVEMYKILTGKYDVTKLKSTTSSETRGNFLRLDTFHPKHDK